MLRCGAPEHLSKRRKDWPTGDEFFNGLSLIVRSRSRIR